MHLRRARTRYPSTSMRPFVKLLLAATAMASLGCSDASGGIQGGDPLFSVAVVDAGALDDDSGSIASASCQDAGNTGSRWQDLYACYFGPTGVGAGGCGSPGSGGLTCHGVGGAGTAFFTCPPMSDPTPCWTGMMNVASGGTSDPTMTTLYNGLRKPEAIDMMMTINNMPLVPTSVVFQPADLERIKAWIKGGALNN
jgi:hypothetical protein